MMRERYAIPLQQEEQMNVDRWVTGKTRCTGLSAGGGTLPFSVMQHAALQGCAIDAIMSRLAVAT